MTWNRDACVCEYLFADDLVKCVSTWFRSRACVCQIPIFEDLLDLAVFSEFAVKCQKEQVDCFVV